MKRSTGQFIRMGKKGGAVFVSKKAQELFVHKKYRVFVTETNIIFKPTDDNEVTGASLIISTTYGDNKIYRFVLKEVFNKIGSGTFNFKELENDSIIFGR